MAKISEEQKQIAFALISGAKTAEELSKELGASFSALQEQLKEMLKEELITRDGFPTKYSLKPEITAELERRKKIEETDKNNIRLHAIIEFVAVESSLLKKAVDTLTDTLKKDKDFTVYDLKTSPVLKQEEEYSTFIDLNVSAKNFQGIVKFMYYYGPSSVEVIKPSKLEISAQDFQDGLMDMAELIQTYTQYIAKMMNREELENLHKRIISPKA